MSIKVEKLHDVLKLQIPEYPNDRWKDMNIAISDGSIKRIINREMINELDNIDIVVRGIYQTGPNEVTIFYSEV